MPAILKNVERCYGFAKPADSGGCYVIASQGGTADDMGVGLEEAEHA
jgi:hypothetical protein